MSPARQRRRLARAHKILYVEDNPANALLMRHVMKQLPELELVVAVTGREGLEQARLLSPVVILLDINLPDIDGFEVLSLLKSDMATQSIPVIALTANAMPREVKRGAKPASTATSPSRSG